MAKSRRLMLNHEPLCEITGDEWHWLRAVVLTYEQEHETSGRLSQVLGYGVPFADLGATRKERAAARKQAARDGAMVVRLDEGLFRELQHAVSDALSFGDPEDAPVAQRLRGRWQAKAIELVLSEEAD